jgi:hypothetical protein
VIDSQLSIVFVPLSAPGIDLSWRPKVHILIAKMLEKRWDSLTRTYWSEAKPGKEGAGNAVIQIMWVNEQVTLREKQKSQDQRALISVKLAL